MADIPSIVQGDFQFLGSAVFVDMTMPDGVVTDAKVSAGAKIATSKLRHRKPAHFAQLSTAAPTNETRVLHTVFGLTGELVAFRFGQVSPCTGAAIITIDIKKNGVSIVTPLVLDNTNTVRVVEVGVITTAALVAGDVLEVVVTTTIGGGALGLGLFGYILVDEDPA